MLWNPNERQSKIGHYQKSLKKDREINMKKIIGEAECW